MIVGTHFYQTHPNFMEHFVNSKQVKFILKTDGIYHPKVYLFSNSSDDWECIVGSANFTRSALTRNAEIVVHIKSTDSDSAAIYKTLMAAIDSYWADAESISQEDYHNYNNIWIKNTKKLNSLKEIYGKLRKNKPLIRSRIFAINWDEYFERINNDQFHSYEGRIKLLRTAHKYFSENGRFSQMNEIQRREIAGIATENQSDSSIDWGWFGSMLGAGRFQNRINTNNTYISSALDAIPMQGEIYKYHYDEFVELFQRAFPGGGSGVGIASRLLAMKRPDYFVCLDNKNRPRLCADFGISRTVSFEAYWDEIVERILDSVWWSSERPTDEAEIPAWLGRAAMLDAIFYEE